MNGLSYSRLMHGLKLAGIEVNRKMLAELAVSDEKAFAEFATAAKNSLNK
jgi:large subunit ribosomal protein L20